MDSQDDRQRMVYLEILVSHLEDALGTIETCARLSQTLNNAELVKFCEQARRDAEAAANDAAASTP